MVTRQTKNLLKEVLVNAPGTPFHGRTGILVSFRGSDACFVRVAGGLYGMSLKNITIKVN